MPDGRRELLVSRLWIQAAALVFLVGFFILGLLAVRTYTGRPPIPERVLDPAGRVVFTGEDVLSGQELFLRSGLMEYGSVFGHGGYLGPDFTADYLRRAAQLVARSHRESEKEGGPRTRAEFRTNRYDAGTGTLRFTAAQAKAFAGVRQHVGEFFAEPSARTGLRPGILADGADRHRLTAFFAWS